METNYYTYEVHKNTALNIPLHIVEYHSPITCGCAVFSNAKEATAFIRSLKNDFSLEYDFTASINKNILTAYINAASLFSKTENKQLYLAY